MATQILPGVTITPRVADTTAGPVEFHLTEGEGPVVLASHGGLGGLDQARLMLGWLDPTEYRLLSVSRPGYLGTPLTSGGENFQAQADLFAALLDTLGVDKAAVVTLSAGGPSGYLLAARHPDRVSALVAISSVTGHHTMPETAGPITQAIFMSHWGQRIITTIGRKRPAWLLRQIFQSTGYFTKRQIRTHLDHTTNSADAVAFVRAFVDTMNPYRERTAGNDNDTRLFEQMTHVPVAEVRCPTLVVHGTHDADVKFHHGVYAYEHIPAAQRLWLEEGCHLGFWLGPQATMAQTTAREFLDRHRPW